MTPEEKAKRYDEAFAYARNVYRLSSNPAEIQRMAEIFPELIESEDEKVRKAIIDFFSEPGRKEYILNGFTVDSIIAWLEKQGQKKHKFIIGDIISDGKVEFRVDNIVKNAIGQDCYFLVNIESEKNGTRYCKLYDSEGKTRNSGETTWLCEQVDAKFEKQDEKIPVIDFKAKDWYVSKVDGKIHNIYYSADKHEPKFHEGNWITNGDYTWKIVEVKPLDYILQSQEGNIVDDTISHVDEQFHSFTIQDAKDGDVLSNGKMIVIFKYFEDPSYRQRIVAYIGLDNKGDIQITDGVWELGIDKAKPVTKEQRDLLFQKMKEAGYEWNEETHELKKISPRMVSAETKEALYDKPAWSEEDEKTLNEIFSVAARASLRKSTLFGKSYDYIKWQKFLKSLRPQNKWKPSEEQMEALESATENCAYSEYQDCLRELIEQLKKLK